MAYMDFLQYIFWLQMDLWSLSNHVNTNGAGTVKAVNMYQNLAEICMWQIPSTMKSKIYKVVSNCFNIKLEI